MSAITRPWLGPLSLASRELVTCLHAMPSFAALIAPTVEVRVNSPTGIVVRRY